MPIIDVNGDGQVLKRIVRSGLGDMPSTGSRVAVHYRGRVAPALGSAASAESSTPVAFETNSLPYFDNSWARGVPLEFTLGQDPVIAGWTDVVATMRPGELAEVTIAPLKAYGAAGKSAAIPPNATLIFDMLLCGQGSSGAKVNRSPSAMAKERPPRNIGAGASKVADATHTDSMSAKDVSKGDGVWQLLLRGQQTNLGGGEDMADDGSKVALQVR